MADPAVPCNYAIQTQLCTDQTCCLAQGFLHYRPSVAANAAYLAAFATLLLPQVALSLRHGTRLWGWQVTSALVLEVVGYAGRLRLHGDVFSKSAFLMYLIPIAIAPAFLIGAIYFTFGRIVVVYGRHLTPFSPRNYTLAFIAIDLLALVLQAAGSAVASNSGSTADKRRQGLNTMIAGMVFQLVSLTVFAVAALDFARRVARSRISSISSSSRRGRSEPKAIAGDGWRDVTERGTWKGFLISLALAILFIYVRCIYRVVELWDGFAGAVANNQTLFLVLEGPMIFAAAALLTLFHPGRAFRGRFQEAEFTWRTRATMPPTMTMATGGNDPRRRMRQRRSSRSGAKATAPRSRAYSPPSASSMSSASMTGEQV